MDARGFCPTAKVRRGLLFCCKGCADSWEGLLGLPSSKVCTSPFVSFLLTFGFAEPLLCTSIITLLASSVGWALNFWVVAAKFGCSTWMVYVYVWKLSSVERPGSACSLVGSVADFPISSIETWVSFWAFWSYLGASFAASLISTTLDSFFGLVRILNIGVAVGLAWILNIGFFVEIFGCSKLRFFVWKLIFFYN